MLSMKRFRLVFGIIYIISALVVLYFSIDILLNTEAYLSKVKLSAYIKFPKYVMTVFLTLSLMMILEFVMDQFSISKEKGKISSLENEVLQLKAKLYDKAQTELPEAVEQEADDSVAADEEDKDD